MEELLKITRSDIIKIFVEWNKRAVADDWEQGDMTDPEHAVDGADTFIKIGKELKLF